MSDANFTFTTSKKICVRIVSTSALAIMGLAVGGVPEVAWRSPSAKPIARISFANRVLAQQFTPEETANYARAGFEVEMLRRQAYQEIKNIINEPPGDIVCDREETLASLDPRVKEITQNFCNQTLEIVQRNNLSVERYNQLKNDYEQQGEFYQQVQNKLLELQ